MIRKKVLVIFILSIVLSGAFVLADWTRGRTVKELVRNDYGGGDKVEEYEVSVEGELDAEPFSVNVGERMYTETETQQMFQKMMEELDQVILGDNKSPDRVEQDLKLVDCLGEYPADIRWELSDYQVLDANGRIIREQTVEEGTLVELRGYITYGGQEAVYVTSVMVYPETKTGKEKWLELLREVVEQAEESTRENANFSLPNEVAGKTVVWEKKRDTRGFMVLLCGLLCCGLLVWNEKQKERDARLQKQEQMQRDYPDIISKVTLLLGTGMTIRQVWIKLVQGYEEQKEDLGERAAYEEMRKCCNEMQGGISEAESYERFGRRCGSTVYLKFGALLSQNLRKGSRGLTDLLRMESIQAFENRKSMARRKGEEAGTKLLVPMMGMLAVVMILVIVPAFLSIQI